MDAGGTHRHGAGSAAQLATGSGRAIAWSAAGSDATGVQPTVWLARAAERQASLLVVLHGLGMTGRYMAAVTGLAQRGPTADFATVFPDGWAEVWNDGLRLPRRHGTDDAGFVARLVDRLVADRLALSGIVFLVGLSNGAAFAEHLARHGLGARDWCRARRRDGHRAEPRRIARWFAPSARLSFAGTADPVVPYAGGPICPPGLIGGVADRRRGEPRRIGVAAETVAADWAAANGGPRTPAIDPHPGPPGDLPVTRLTWVATNGRPVVLHRIEGGGHGWPGGAQQIPARLTGPVARRLDATGILLEMAQREAVRVNATPS